MAISKQYMKDWQYDPDDTSSHITRAGLALLPEGIEWRTKNAYKEAFATDKWKLHSVNSILADIDGPTAHLGASQADHADVLALAGSIPAAAKTSTSGLPDPPDGMVAVDTSGNPAQKIRTAQLWKTINPGCMPEYTSLPISTAHEAFTLDYSCIPEVDKRVHRKKNDFTEHTEQGASIMKALISDKK